VYITLVWFLNAAIENFPVIAEYLGFVKETLMPTSEPVPISLSNPTTVIQLSSFWHLIDPRIIRPFIG